MASVVREGEVSRDVRVDRIGFVRELNKEFGDPLVDAVKLTHALPGTRLQGDFFSGLISGGTVRSISPADWMKLYDKNEISRAEFLGALKVSVDAAEKTLRGRTFESIVSERPAENRLIVTRQKGVEEQLIQAVKGMDLTLANEMTRMRVAKGAAA